MVNKPEWPYALSGTVAAAVQGIILPFFALILSRIITVFCNPVPHFSAPLASAHSLPTSLPPSRPPSNPLATPPFPPLPDKAKMRSDADFWSLMFVVLAVVAWVYIDKAKMRTDADFWSLMFVILAVVAWVSRTLQTFLFSVAGQRLIWRIRRMCFYSVLRQQMAWLTAMRTPAPLLASLSSLSRFLFSSSTRSGAIGSRLSSDATHVHSIVGDRLSLAVQNAATLVAGLILAFSSLWILSFIVLAQLPLIAAGSIFQMRSLQGFADDAKVG
ncbi:unnamed protein product [Closterium sp. NIES-65]|nr:unnamed protein product [Closterium sp. NIES-65]